MKNSIANRASCLKPSGFERTQLYSLRENQVLYQGTTSVVPESFANRSGLQALRPYSKGRNFTPRGKIGFVSGHNLGRAVKSQSEPGFSPCGRFEGAQLHSLRKKTDLAGPGLDFETRDCASFCSGPCHHHLANRAHRSKRQPGVPAMRFVSGPDFQSGRNRPK